jgi:hypothetical protein
MDHTARSRNAMIVLCLLGMLSACASDPHWSQQGKSEEEMRRDYAECRKQVTEKYGTNLESPHFKTDLDQCMQMRGYHRD